MERARTFFRQDVFIKFWFIPAWIGLGVASVAITVIPFWRIAQMLGRLRSSSKPTLSATSAEEARALQVGLTVRLAARYAPWRADCYPQAIVARFMLGFYKIPFTLSFGVKRDPDTGGLLAHAWVQCGSVSVTGGDGDIEYRSLAVFTSHEKT